MSKSVYMETTRVPASRTSAQVSTVLAQAGATSVMMDYADGRAVGLSFLLPIEHIGRVPFRLPIRFQPVFEVIQTRRSPRFRERNAEADREQAERVAWRQVLRWVEAQLAMIGVGMVKAEEVFLPYMRVVGGKTIFEHFAADRFKCLPMPPGDAE